MKHKQILSLLLALTMLLTGVATAMAEDVAPAVDTDLTDEGTQAPAAVIPLDEMLTRAMQDAYQRQADFAAYAEAFPDNRSLAGIDMETQIVLLEMLLKANNITLPTVATTADLPETQADAYAMITQAEGSALEMYRSFLSQSDLATDAKLVFHSVARLVHSNAVVFQRRVQNAQRIQQVQELLNDENTQVYTFNNGRGRGVRIVYTMTNDQPAEDTTTDTPQETTQPAPEPTTGN